MSIRTESASGRRSAVTKSVASLGVLGAAVAVAGMGTFGSFTDSTAPVDSTVATGTLSIKLSPAATYSTVPVSTAGFLPGDRSSTPFDIVNDGDLAWESLTLTSWATRSSLLDSDPVNGLQLTLESCSTSWAVAGSDYTCAGDVEHFYTGPIVTDRALAGASSVAPGQVDHLLATIEFPASTGDAMNGLLSELAFTFTAVQRDGAAR